MNTKRIFKKVAVSIGAATLVLAMSACASHSATAGTDYGQVRTEAAAQQNTSSDQAVGTAPAPVNAKNVTSPSSPAIIPGPAKVDNSGAAYTSSSVGSAGNGSATGLNTNVNIIPNKASSSVTVTQSPSVVAETTTTTTVESTPLPVPPAPEVTAPPESTPMTSSTQETTPAPEPTTHRRMRKD